LDVRAKTWQEAGENFIMRSFIIYYSPNIIRMMKIKEDMGGACSAHGEIRNAYRISVGKSEGKGLLRRRRRRWEDNNKNGSLGKYVGRVLIRFIWLRIGTGGGLL
jgi:hypothetical protein